MPSTHCSLPEFLGLAGMSKYTFFRKYRHDLSYARLLDIRTDHMHRIWIARDAAQVIRAERSSKEVHGNRGKVPRRACKHCGHVGHPRNTHCRGCYSTEAGLGGIDHISGMPRTQCVVAELCDEAIVVPSANRLATTQRAPATGIPQMPTATWHL
jgi:hypothetical protein